jgi:hypothetical protein
MTRLGKLAASILCVGLAVPTVAVAGPIIRGDVRVNVDLPRVIIRDRDRTPPRAYVRFERYDAYDRDDRGYTNYSVAGTYDSRYGRVILQQDGNRVTGHFDHGGMLKGRIRGNALHFRWRSDNGAEGRGVWYLNRRNNVMSGSWGTWDSATNAGEWTIQREGMSRFDRRYDRRYDRRWDR